MPHVGKDLLDHKHREWLEQHMETREKYLYPIYQAALREERLHPPDPLQALTGTVHRAKHVKETSGKVKHLRSWTSHDLSGHLFPIFQRQAEDLNTHDILKVKAEKEVTRKILEKLARPAPPPPPVRSIAPCVPLVPRKTAQPGPDDPALQVTVKWT